MRKEVIKQIIRNFQEKPFPRMIPRDKELPLDTEKIISLIGARRSGKTYLLYETMQRLNREGIPRTDMLYLNFDDERLDLKTDELDLIIQAWKELHGGEITSRHYFFFDEIQNVPAWEKFISRIYEQETRNIFITGSNAEFLSVDIATALRGRTLVYELFPFNFREFIRSRNLSSDFYADKNRIRLLQAFDDYMKIGGFPEVVHRPEEEGREILRTYFYAMLYRDIIERYGVREPGILKYFIKRLADNLTKPVSIHKIYKELHSQGYKLDKNLLYAYLDYVENVYMAFPVDKFDFSFLKRENSLKKVYWIDNGLLNTITIRFSTDRGKLFENAVFLFLRALFGDVFEKRIFYWKNTRECDFVVMENDGVRYCIQASYEMDDEQTYRRETAGLIAGLKKTGLREGFIFTYDMEKTEKKNGFTIWYVPAYKVMLQGEQYFLEIQERN